LTLILGGARSGKSRHAEVLARGLGETGLYVATGQAFDAEMRERIAEHKARRDAFWTTVEAPLDIAAAIDGADAKCVVLVDCLTLWLTNLILGDDDVAAATDRLQAALERRATPVLLVSNEVGLGIVPENALARRFRDEAGRLHQRLAQTADRVLFMVAGLPLVAKG
jgi:adenosylcobinamide kinase/adenosylcobinamide-phosphate guanylyltransferase